MYNIIASSAGEAVKQFAELKPALSKKINYAALDNLVISVTNPSLI